VELDYRLMLSGEVVSVPDVVEISDSHVGIGLSKTLVDKKVTKHVEASIIGRVADVKGAGVV
jgi:hypothetical protein